MTGFTVAAINAPNVSLANLGSSDGGTTWSATLTPSASTTAASNGITLNYAGITDLAGNAGSGSATSSNYAVDTSIFSDGIPPLSPMGLSLTTTSDTGLLFTDQLTSLLTPTITGTAEALSIVVLYGPDFVTSLGMATADLNGAWSITTTPLSAGIYRLTARATDVAGNVSSASEPLTLTIDPTPPAVPTGLSLTNDSDTGISSTDRLTSNTAPTITGIAEAYSNLVLYDTDGTTAIGSVFADSSGSWSMTTASLSDGLHDLTAKSTDLAGNSYGASDSFPLRVDAARPSIAARGVTSSSAPGTYGVGSVIFLNVYFSEQVYVSGSPTLLLETGATDRSAFYFSGSGTNVLSFAYTVQAGDTSSDLDFNSVLSLSPNGGTTTDAAGNHAVLTLSEPGTSGSLGAYGALAIDGIVPSAVSTFRTTYGLSSLVNKASVLWQQGDPFASDGIVAASELRFGNATVDPGAISGLQLAVRTIDSAATVVCSSDLVSFTISSSLTTSGNVSGSDVVSAAEGLAAVFESLIQEVDLYFAESPLSASWNALYKKKINGEFYLFNYDPLTGLGGILLDRDGNGSIDGARLYLKDGSLGDIDETVNGEIVDPIGFTTLSVDPALRVSDDGSGLTVDGIVGTGLWLSMSIGTFRSLNQGSLEIYNASSGDSYGVIGATLGSGPNGEQSLYLSAGTTINFRYSNGVGQATSNPAISILSTPDGFSLGVDIDRNGTYTDLMLDITSSIAASSPGSLAMARKQLASSDAILDLTSIAATGLTLSLDISTDCGLRNRFGFVKLDPLTGTTYQVAGVSQSDGAAFRSAILSQFIDPYLGTTTSHRYGQSRQTISWALDSSAAGYYAPVMVTQGGEVFTFGASTASDGRQHVKLLGTNTFGFEDLLASQGSDWDFNDTKIRVNVV